MTALFLSTVLAFDATPKATIQAFIDALHAHDAAGAAKRVVGGQPTRFALTYGMPTLSVEMGEESIQGDDATVKLDAFLEGGGRTLHETHETVDLKRIGGDWKIVPTPASVFTARPKKTNDSLVANWATLVTDASVMGQALQAAEQTQSLRKMKLIAMATLRYVVDHQNRLPSAANFRAAVTPYLPEKDAFTAPGAPRGTVSYFLEPRLSNRSFNSVPRPAETAMIIQGTPQKTAFPYRGRTVVGFVDGHVRIHAPAELRKARTTPLE